MSAVFGAVLVAGAAAAARPNVLFMMADQMRFDSMGSTGNKAARTPALDRIAAEGLRMEWSWSSTPTCTPARAGILTGRSPWNHGMLGYGAVAPWYPVEMPTTVAAAGYITHSIGKDHFGWNATTDHGIAHGYQATELYDGLGSWNPKAPTHWSGEYDDYDKWFQSVMPGKDPEATLDAQGAAHGGANDGWNGWHGAAYVYDEQYHPTAWVGRQAVSFIQAANKTSAPFLLKVSFHRPHSPYDPPARVMNQFKVEDLPPIVAGTGWDLRFRGQPGDPIGCGPSDPDAWCGLMPTNLSNVSRVAYYGSVSFVDEQVGHIYDALVESNLLETSYIIWTSDHGDGQGDHYHWRKGYPYEFSAHVPMLLRWPQSEVGPRGFTAPRGLVIKNLVSELRDVFHTVVDATKALTAQPVLPFQAEDGKSMLCLLTDPTGQHCTYPLNPGPWRQYLDMEHSTCYNNSNHWNALTDGRMKYVFRAYFGDEQLFNLTADPTESVELSQDPTYATTLKLWRGRMVAQFESENRGPTWVQNGTLMQRSQGQTYSPNYPRGPPAVPNTKIALAQNGAANDQWTLNGSAVVLQGSNPLCLAVDGEASTGAGLITAECLASAASQSFTTVPAPTVKGAFHFIQIVHTTSKLCITASGNSVSLATCGASPADTQVWVDGASGRICADKLSGECLTAGTSWEEWEAHHGAPATDDLRKY